MIIGLFSIICALWIQDVLTALDIAYAILSGAMFFPIILGFFWRKATAAAAFWSILISAAAVIGGLVWKGADSGEPIMYGLAVSGMTMVLAVYALPAAKLADHESSLETANLQDAGKGETYGNDRCKLVQVGRKPERDVHDWKKRKWRHIKAGFN
ncbi:hypothetical protein QKW52_27105 [Bacillus sonorensis]|nr:hypothetical protein [Bacillus sonorensis]